MTEGKRQRMFIMKRQEYRIAYQKAKEINTALSRQGIDEDSFTPLSAILECVKNATNYSDIQLLRSSFREFFNNDESFSKEMTEAGAMLSTETHTDKMGNVSKCATLVVNNDKSPEMQRFSIAHELGHLITAIPNFIYEEPNDGEFTLSTHINSDLTYISEEECDKSQYLVAEQAANIFALLVLIRKDIKIRDLVSEDGVRRLTEKYGVTEDALFSRMLLSVINDGGENVVNGR